MSDVARREGDPRHRPWARRFRGTATSAEADGAANSRPAPAAQTVERFEDLNENSQRLFATPDEGLNR